MASETDATAEDQQVPAESALLKAAYKRSGLTVADLAAASGLSVGTLHIAFTGIRYRDGIGKPAVPADQTLVKVGSVLRIDPQMLRAVGRDRAADLLAEAMQAGDMPTAASASDLNAQAAVAGRTALAKQILAAFSTEELRAEIARRQQHDEASDDEQTYQELADDLKAAQFPG